MTGSRSKLEKFGAVALGAVCVFLVFKLISEISGSPADAARGEETVAHPASLPSKSSRRLAKQAGKLAASDPSLEIQALKEYVARPLPNNLRDPFDFAAPPPPKMGPGGSLASGAAGSGAAGGAVGNAPPPQISLRAIGYSLRAGVGGEAYLADADQVYIVHQGDVVEKQYKILRVTPSIVEVRNNASGETVQLPIPEVQ